MVSEQGGRSRFAKDAARKLEEIILSGQLEEEQYRTGATWAAVDLDPYKRGEQVVEPPRFFRRDDGKALVYPGRPHVFYGESESLKSWAALEVCREVVMDRDAAVTVRLSDRVAVRLVESAA